MNIKGILRKRIASFVLAGTMSGSILGVLPVNTNATEISSVVDINEEKTLTSDYYETKEEAIEWIERTKGEIGELNKIIDINLCLYKGYHKETETMNIDEIYENYSDVLKRIEEIGNITYFNCNLEVEEIKDVKKVIKNIEINKAFCTIEELNEYKKTLDNKEELNIKVTEINKNINTENIFKYGLLNKKNNLPKYDKLKERIRVYEKLNKEKPNAKYLLTATYNDEVEELSISYNLKGDATRTIHEDRYYAEIVYKPYSIKLSNEGILADSKVKVKKL